VISETIAGGTECLGATRSWRITGIEDVGGGKQKFTLSTHKLKKHGVNLHVDHCPNSS